MSTKRKVNRIRRDAEALKDDTRDLIDDTVSHPAVYKVVDAIRGRPVTAVVVTAAALLLGSRFTHRRQSER
jgi:hypothetical protein